VREQGSSKRRGLWLDRLIEAEADVNALPPFARSDLNRFLQRTLEFIGRNHCRRAEHERRFRPEFKMVVPPEYGSNFFRD
jgi:hypothetical protein